MLYIDDSDDGRQDLQNPALRDDQRALCGARV